MNAVTILQMHSDWHHLGLFMGMAWAWWRFWIATLAVVLWALGAVIRERGQVHRRAEAGLQAEEVLRQRFARGEISEDEFAARLRVLHGSRTSA